MGTGYTRNDTSNNIADGNIINASDLDGEFDAIESAMGTSGHTHDGTSAEGGPVTVVGPAQDLVVTASEVKPKTDNTLDLGTSSLQFKNAYFQGTVDTDGIMTAATFEPDGDTAAGDNAAIGYTAAEGLILTGQGSTSDITFKNDADTTVFSIPTGTDDVLFPDNAKAMFGAGSDLQIYHTGSASYIDDAGTGNLFIRANDFRLGKYTGEFYLKGNSDGNVELYYDNALKLATTSTGISVTGNATFADDGKAIFGAGSDLSIYHDGTRSYIEEAGLGGLWISTNGTEIKLKQGGGVDEEMLVATPNGSVDLYYNNNLKLATTSTGVDITGTLTSDGLTVDGVGVFSSASPNIRMDETDTTDLNTRFRGQAGAFRIETTTDAAGLVGTRLLIDHSTGDISFFEDTGSSAKLTWDASAESLNFADDGKAIFGAGSDLTIEHNGTNSTITNTTGHLTISNTADDKDVDIVSDDGSGGTAVYFRADGSSGQVKLYHNDSGTGTLRLNTSSDGIDITGHADIEGHFTATDGCTITTADNSTQLTLKSTDTDANEGPRLDLQRDSASPADGDLIGTIRYLGEDDGGTAHTFGEVQVKMTDITDGTEDSEMFLMIRNNGNLRNAVEIGSTEVVFNEASDDVDFRVESDGDTHALFVQGSSGNVGIGTSSPANKFVVAEGTNQHGVEISAGTTSYIQAYDRATSDYGDLRIDAQTIAFATDDGSERARLDASGNLLVGTTNSSLGTGGIQLNASGRIGAAASSLSPMVLNRKTADGTIIDLRKDGSTVGSIGTRLGANLLLASNGGSVYTDDNFRPNADNAYDIGLDSLRFDDIYATNGTIQTSDRNEKQDIEELTEAEQRVAVAAKGLLRKFRWKSAVEEKGEAARTHFGIIAQDLQAAFEAEGLDAGDYAMFISSTWWEHQVEVPAVEAVDEVLDDEGNVVTEAVEAADAYTRTDTYDTAEEAPEGATQKTRLGVRYSELLAFIIAAI